MTSFLLSDESINFEFLARTNMVFVTLMSLAAFLTQLAFLNTLRYNHTIAVLATTLKQSSTDIINSLFCIFIVMTAFAAYMHVEYGPHLSEYRSVMMTYAAQFSGFMGVFDYTGIYEAQGTLGAFMLILYLLIITNLFLNLFISILSDYMSAIHKDPEVVPKDHEVVEHVISMVKEIFGIESDESRQRRLARKRGKNQFTRKSLTLSFHEVL